MQDISVSVVEGRVHLDCSGFGLEDEVIYDELMVLVPLLERLLTADRTRDLLDDDVVADRLRGILAQDMVVQASVTAAVRQANLLIDIAAGKASIRDHGFPEFQDGREIDV
jgi:hypothetical protein